MISEEPKCIKRGPRTHGGQYEIYLAHLERHNQLRTGAGDPVALSKLWKSLCDELNAYGVGATKSSSEWQATFRQWKNHTRHKARAIHAHGSGTGGGPANLKMLTDLEERALSVWGREVLDGTQIGCVSIDFPNSSTSVETIELELDDDMMSMMLPPISTPTKPSISTTTPTHVPFQINTTAPAKKQRTTPRERTLDALKEGDEAISSAICRLADRIGDVANTMATSNDLMRTVIENQNNIIKILIEKY